MVAGEGEPAAAEPAGQPAFPPLTTQATNLFHAVVAFVGDGCGIVDDAQYRRRLEICRTCDRRTGNRCTDLRLLDQPEGPRPRVPLPVGAMAVMGGAGPMARKAFAE